MRSASSVLFILVAVAFVLIGSIGISLFTGRVSFTSNTAGFVASPDVSFGVDATVRYGATEVPTGSLVCAGATLTVTPSQTSTYTVASRNEVDVRCPTATCTVDPTVVSPGTMTVRWLSTAAYNGVPSSQGLDPTTGCRFGLNLAEPFTLDNVDAIYFRTSPAPTQLNGRARIGVYCRGNVDVRYDGASVAGGSQDISAPFSPVSITVPSVPGIHTIRNDMVIGDCATFARSFESGARADRNYHCIYNDPGTLTRTVTGNSMTFTVVNPANLTLIGSTMPATATPGQNMVFTFALRNDGGVAASITGVSLTNLTVNSITPVPPPAISVAPGATVTFTVDADAPTGQQNYNVAVLVNYSGASGFGCTTPILNSRLSIGTLSTGLFAPPVSISVIAAPSAIVEGDIASGASPTVTVTGNITRPTGSVGSVTDGNLTIQCYDLALNSWITRRYRISVDGGLSYQDCGNPGINCPARYCETQVPGQCNQYIPFSINRTDPQLYTFRLVQPLSPPNVSLGTPWTAGVCRTVVSVYDAANQSVRSGTAYFVIYSMNGNAQRACIART